MRASHTLAIAVMLSLVGCAAEAPAPAGDDLDTEGLTVENLRLVPQRDGSSVVRGVVVNTSTAERSVQVVISLFDARNQRVGEVQVPVENVAAGAQQGFSRTLDRDAAGASLRRLLVF